MYLKSYWRILATSLVSVCLLTAASISALGAQPNTAGNRAASAPRIYTPIKGTGKLAGIVDLAKTPKLTPGAQTATSNIDLPRDPLAPAQRQAYEQSVRANPQVKNPHPNTRSGDGRNPAFVGGGVIPLIVKNVDGLTSAQAGGFVYPDTAIATDLSYVMEGVNNAVAIYYASSGALAYGPYSAQSFFAPVYNTGDIFFNPQMYYDVMRDRWMVSWLQKHAGAVYLDIAISVSNSPTQPAPGGQYYIYQQGTNFEPSGGTPSDCNRMTMGMDYWGLYFTCQNFRGSTFVGNTMIAFSKSTMLSGGGYFWWYYNDGLQMSGGGPAAVTSPAIEEGVQDAEFFLSTDAGLGGPSSNMGLCAWTNLSNITTTPPTLTCMNINLGLAYTDPLFARQPSGPNVSPSFGPKQVYYKAGRLYLAQSTALAGNHDGIYWAEVKPQLTTKAAHNPQWVNGAVVTQVAYYDFGSSVDVYTPTLMGTDENDIILFYNLSGPTLNPSIGLTGRKATDADNTLGQGAYSWLLSGAHAHTTSSWGEYSSCAISLNSVTRGTIWCAAEYAGAVAAPGWNTRLFNFRVE
ncbi:MAG TPA: hypothetical protein VH393_07140 [Ktedonobacterales bacterium]|jgi:hypothetical protein